VISNSILGGSVRLAELRRFIARAAGINWSVLIQGESGTGKELVARAIHLNSQRCASPFIAVNCATLSESLLESELFGHERGSFTGAVTQKKGKFELAAGGTLFLDEVGELSVSIQAKLLRALQEREIDRIGGTRPIPVDIRVIAATNRDLESAVAEGYFRQDLYYRLKVLAVRTPALRERPEDIPVLARHFLFKYAQEAGRVVHGISAEAELILMKYDWPGNVRELQNVMQHAIALGGNEIVLPEDLPGLGKRAPNGFEGHTYHKVVYDTKRHLFENAFTRAGGDYREAALLLGLNPKNMHRFLKQLKLTYLLQR